MKFRECGNQNNLKYLYFHIYHIMTNASPEIVDSKLKKGEIDEKAAIALLISIVENSESESTRIKSIDLLSQMNLYDDTHYKFIEGLVISDSSAVIQEYAARILIDKFKNQSLEAIKWLIKQKRSISLVSKVLKILLKKEEGILREILIKSFNSVLFGNIDFVKSEFKPHIEILVSEYKDYFSETPFNKISTGNLLEIYLGFETLVFIGDHYDVFYDLGFDLEDGYVTGLRIEGSGSAKWERPSDIEGLNNLPKLEEMTLKRCGFKEIGTLDHFPDLRILELSESFISDIENLDNLVKLEHLSLGSNRIKELKGVDKLTQLKSLMLFDNQIGEIKGLNNLDNLLRLNLSDNQIKELKGLESLKNLERLYMSRNRIKRLEGFELLRHLEILALNENKITKITGFDSLVNLQILDLSFNQIKKIEGIDKLLNLRKLRLNNNRITAFEGIQGLELLEIITLNDNKISKVGDLEAIKHFVLILLSNNDLSDKLESNLRYLEKKKGIKIDL